MLNWIISGRHYFPSKAAVALPVEIIPTPLKGRPGALSDQSLIPPQSPPLLNRNCAAYRQRSDKSLVFAANPILKDIKYKPRRCSLLHLFKEDISRSLPQSTFKMNDKCTTKMVPSINAEKNIYAIPVVSPSPKKKSTGNFDRDPCEDITNSHVVFPEKNSSSPSSIKSLSKSSRAGSSGWSSGSSMTSLTSLHSPLLETDWEETFEHLPKNAIKDIATLAKIGLDHQKSFLALGKGNKFGVEPESIPLLTQDLTSKFTTGNTSKVAPINCHTIDISLINTTACTTPPKTSNDSFAMNNSATFCIQPVVASSTSSPESTITSPKIAVISPESSVSSPDSAMKMLEGLNILTVIKKNTRSERTIINPNSTIKMLQGMKRSSITMNKSSMTKSANNRESVKMMLQDLDKSVVASSITSPENDVTNSGSTVKMSQGLRKQRHKEHAYLFSKKKRPQSYRVRANTNKGDDMYKLSKASLVPVFSQFHRYGHQFSSSRFQQNYKSDEHTKIGRIRRSISTKKKPNRDLNKFSESSVKTKRTSKTFLRSAIYHPLASPKEKGGNDSTARDDGIIIKTRTKLLTPPINKTGVTLLINTNSYNFFGIKTKRTRRASNPNIRDSMFEKVPPGLLGLDKILADLGKRPTKKLKNRVSRAVIAALLKRDIGFGISFVDSDVVVVKKSLMPNSIVHEVNKEISWNQKRYFYRANVKGIVQFASKTKLVGNNDGEITIRVDYKLIKACYFE